MKAENMRFLSMIRIDETTGQKPSERLKREMGTLMEEMIHDGSLVRTAGLRPTREGVRVRSNHGKVSITDGPFSETKEQVGGFFIIEAQNLNEAIRIASKHPAAHLGEQVGWGIEVRPMDMFDPAESEIRIPAAEWAVLQRFSDR